jgi:hypothetical protein
MFGSEVYLRKHYEQEHPDAIVEADFPDKEALKENHNISMNMV